MIELAHPAMAWNARGEDAVPRYKLTNSIDVAPGTSIDWLCGWTAVVFEDFKKKYRDKRKRLVINSHGLYLRNSKGQAIVMGIDIGTRITSPKDVRPFEKLAPSVDDILICSCGVARIEGKGGGATADGEKFREGAGDGNLLCGAIAKAAKAIVWASTAEQIGKPFPRSQQIDDWTGTVLKYMPDGSVGGAYSAATANSIWSAGG